MRIELKDLVGRHVFSGCELIPGTEKVGSVCRFTLDGIHYQAEEDPDDGYRSYMDKITVCDTAPKYSFPGVLIDCTIVKQGAEGAENALLSMADVRNGKTIFEIGTDYSEWYYPVCVFDFRPENMSCNEEQKGLSE